MLMQSRTVRSVFLMALFLLVIFFVSACSGHGARHIEDVTGISLDKYEVVEHGLNKGVLFGDNSSAWILRSKIGNAEIPDGAKKSDRSDYIFAVDAFEDLLAGDIELAEKDGVYRMGTKRSDAYIIKGVDPEYLYVCILHN